MPSPNETLNAIPQVRALLETADVIDLKSIQAHATLRQFIAAMLSYQPAWVTSLYYVRWVLMRLIGLTQDGIPESQRLRPEDVAFTPGDKTDIFAVQYAEENRCWIGGITDQHLNAELVVVAAPSAAGITTFYAVTLVHFNKPIGRYYFRLIAPFHHLIVRLAMRSAVATVSAAASTRAAQGRAG